MSNTAAPGKETGGLFRMMAPHKGKMLLAISLSALGQFCGIIPFILIYFMVIQITDGTASAGAQNIWPLVASGACAVVFKYVFSGAATFISHAVAYDVLYDLRINISKKLATLPLGYFSAASSGQIKKVMLEDVEQMEIFIGHNVPELVGGFIYLVLALLVLFIFDWRLALATICLLPLGIFAQMLTVSRNKPLREKYFTASENTNTAIIQYIQAMPVIKVFNQTAASFKKYSDSVRECAHYEALISKRWLLPMSFFSVVSNAALLILLPVGGLLYLSGDVSLPTLVLFMLMGLGIGNFLTQCMMLGSFMEENMEGQARIKALLTTASLPEATTPLQSKSNDITGEAMEFSYGAKNVLHGVDFHLPAGKFMALVGPSGAGKTTLARLIPRFWDLQAGAIRIGGVDIRDMNIEDLMEKITFVFQDVFLFNDSISANLRVGRPNATQEEIEAAARAARCHDFIMNLPGGYGHVIGERGGRLSGGERQRISIARALLKDAPIVVMDEATAFIDPENEVLIQGAINALVSGKTLVIIAHRLSTIMHADQILVVEEGKIAARGKHDELLETSSRYRHMWDTYTASQRWTLQNMPS